MPAPTAPRRRLQQQVNSVEAQPQQQTPSAIFIGGATPLVPGNIFGRMGRGAVAGGSKQVNAPVASLAAGNSVNTADARGNVQAGIRKNSNTGGPGKWGKDTGVGNESPFGSVSGRQIRQVNTPNSLDSAGGSARTDAFQHGHLIAHDRHIIANQGRTTSSNRQQATGGSPNPEASGPPRPTWKMFNRTLSHMYGADTTRGLDNGQFHAAIFAASGTERQRSFTHWSAMVTNASQGQKFPLGTQGTEWAPRYGGTPGLANFRPYGYRGGFSAAAPKPTVRAETGGPYLPRTLLQIGDPGDGPQKVYGGLPWGLHSPTLPARRQTQSNIRSKINQVKPVWNVRPLNNKSSGQSWSQSMVSLSGQQAVKLASTAPIRQPGMNSRWLGN